MTAAFILLCLGVLLLLLCFCAVIVRLERLERLARLDQEKWEWQARFNEATNRSLDLGREERRDVERRVRQRGAL